MLSEHRLLKTKDYAQKSRYMTLEGVVQKTFFAFGFALFGFFVVWHKYGRALMDFTDLNALVALRRISFAGTFFLMGLGWAVCLNPSWAPYTTLLYSWVEGLTLGAISIIVESIYPGVALQACLATGAVFFSILFCYLSGFIKVTQGMRRFVYLGTFALFLFYAINMVLAMFGFNDPFALNDGGLLGIGFSLFVIGFCSFSLLVDMDAIERASRARLPRHMEWYCAFSLFVSVVWLYIEILKLLIKLRKRKR